MLGTIMCDMDGVLVDFLAGVRHVTGHAWDWYKTKEQREQRNRMVFEQGDAFWQNLPPMPDFHQLWGYIEPYHPHILTAIPSGPRGGQRTETSRKFAEEGKWLWCQQHLRIPADHFHCVEREHKANYATQVVNGHVVSNVLIDDHEPNCAEFRRNRGQAILHKDATDTIKQLKAMGYGH